MTFAECIPFLLKGYYIRKTHFSSGHCIKLDEFNHNILSYYTEKHNDGIVGPYEISNEDLKDTCWEVVE